MRGFSDIRDQFGPSNEVLESPGGPVSAVPPCAYLYRTDPNCWSLTLQKDRDQAQYTLSHLY